MMTSVIGSRRGGFSLLELMISLALISILSGLFVVHFTKSDTSENHLESWLYQFNQMVLSEARSSTAFNEDRSVVFGEQRIVSSSRELSIPDELSIHIRRANESAFRSWAVGEEWLFHPGALIEPITFRFIYEDAIREVVYDPLTATPVS